MLSMRGHRKGEMPFAEAAVEYIILRMLVVVRHGERDVPRILFSLHCTSRILY